MPANTLYLNKLYTVRFEPDGTVRNLHFLSFKIR